MSPAQNSKYWRRWADVQRKNGWRWLKGRLVATPVTDASQYHAAVWRIATDLANRACRAVVADDLRHACHVLAFGRDISHESLSNSQFDRLLLLWGNEREYPGLLVDPENIATHVAWDNPDQSRKVSLIRSIKAAAADEYICQITQDIWGTIYWEDLDVSALLGLLRKLKGNAPTRPGQPF
ncbi:hypothetical protein [Silvimonas sp.]|uniref:hypothetical protein n=1 Tax=Silvimonas sp. TaxID=2650811 RepID=UPI0028476825|nr:hypothetical protein [Silvimonas sp.]MDR3427823.1 hypothetical protein [Silvimonas sp.]